MSTILATELYQARRDAALATSKLLLGNSSHELRNAPINSIKSQIMKQKFLASSSTNVNIQQQQKSSYSATGSFKNPRQPTKIL